MKPKYSDFVALILNDKYNVIPVEAYAEEWKPDKINILLRHDLDDDNGLGFMQLEAHAGLRSTYYVMANKSTVRGQWRCTYDVEEVARFYKYFESLGFRFGYHFKDVDEILGGKADLKLKPEEISNDDMSDAIVLFKMNLEKLRRWLNVESVAAHGGCCNWFLDCSKYWEQAWVNVSASQNVFSAYRIPLVNFTGRYMQLSDLDSNATFMRQGVGYFKDQLQKFRAGDIVQILIHPFTPRWSYPIYKDVRGLQPFLRGVN